MGFSSPTALGLQSQFIGSLATLPINSPDPAIPPLVAMAKEIREVINVKAGVSDAGVTEFFDDKEPMDEVI
jgi:hypothetical protein